MEMVFLDMQFYLQYHSQNFLFRDRVIPLYIDESGDNGNMLKCVYKSDKYKLEDLKSRYVSKTYDEFRETLKNAGIAPQE